MAGSHYGQQKFMGEVFLKQYLGAGPDQFLSTDEFGQIVPMPFADDLIDVTFLELDDLSFTNGFKVGRWYRLTDYQTIHTIMEITPGGVITTAEENVGPIEPLLLFANRPGGWVETMVFSTVLPHRLHYSLGGEPSLPSDTPTKGVIHRRIHDAYNLSLPLDWQIVKWKMNGAYYQTFNGPYSNPGDPNLFQQRFGNARNIYVGNKEYDQAPPVIFLSPTAFYGLINIQRCDGLVLDTMSRCQMMYAHFVDVNANAQDLYTGQLINATLSYVTVPTAPFNMRSVTALSSVSPLVATDQAEADVLNNSFLYTSAAGVSRKIKVNTTTNEIEIYV